MAGWRNLLTAAAATTVRGQGPWRKNWCGGGANLLLFFMPSETLARAIAKAKELPDADQERVGRELSAYIDDLHRLRADLSAGLRSLDAGLGKELSMEDVIERARASYARQ